MALTREQHLRVVAVSCIHDEDAALKHNDTVRRSCGRVLLPITLDPGCALQVLSSLEEAVDDHRDAWVLDVVKPRTASEAAALQDASMGWVNVLVIIGDMRPDGSGFQLCGGETWSMRSVARAVARPEARIGMVVVLAPKCDPHCIQAAVRALGYNRCAAVIGGECACGRVCVCVATYMSAMSTQLSVKWHRVCCGRWRVR